MNVKGWAIVHIRVMEEFNKKGINGLQYFPVKLIDVVTQKVNTNYVSEKIRQIVEDNYWTGFTFYGRKVMKKGWIKIVSQVTENFENIHQVVCPNCKKQGLDYLYIGDEKTRVGYLQIWCIECLKGIYISRAVAPINAKFVSFNADLKDSVPKYDLIND